MEQATFKFVWKVSRDKEPCQFDLFDGSWKTIRNALERKFVTARGKNTAIINAVRPAVFAEVMSRETLSPNEQLAENYLKDSDQIKRGELLYLIRSPKENLKERQTILPQEEKKAKKRPSPVPFDYPAQKRIKLGQMTVIPFSEYSKFTEQTRQELVRIGVRPNEARVEIETQLKYPDHIFMKKSLA